MNEDSGESDIKFLFQEYIQNESLIYNISDNMTIFQAPQEAVF